MRYYGILLFLLLLSLISYFVKWPFNWQDGGVLRWRRRHRLHQLVVQKEAESDKILLEVADVVIQLRTNAERLEMALRKLQEEDENDGLPGA